jgi:hypothetical protein
MIKVMSSGGESARTEASLIEFFERVVVQLNTAEQVAASTADSDYVQFKTWEALWQKGSVNLGDGQTTLDSGQGLMADAAGLIPEPLPRADNEMGARAKSGFIPMMAPTADWSSVADMPMMDVFASVFGQGLDASPDSMAGIGTAPGNM